MNRFAGNLPSTMVGLFLMAIPCLAQTVYTPYTFTTLAGLARTPGTNDGAGVYARFAYPQGMTVDSATNVYVADADSSTIRKVTPAGIVTTLAGLAGSFGTNDGTGSSARFARPQGVAVDGAGNVYVAESINSIIRRVTQAGVVTTLAGLAGSYGTNDGTGTNARFSQPSGVAVDIAGNAYVADTGNHTIRKITPMGLVTTLAGQAGSSGSTDGTVSDAQFADPLGVAVDSTGNVYVADTRNHTIRQIRPAGIVTTLAGLAGSSGSADGLGAAARFHYPQAVAVDGSGNVYVADYNNTIRKVTPDGEVTTLAGVPGTLGSTDGTGSGALFSSPSAVAVDSAGNVYVADAANYTIRRGYPALMILNPGLNNGKFGFNLTGPTGQNVVVDSSTDFLNWLPLWTNSFAGDLSFTDPESGSTSNRFYRARTP